MTLSNNHRQVLADVISCLLVVLFGYAAMSKAIDYDLFISQMRQSPMLMHFAPVLGWAVPSFEIMISVALLFKRSQHTALYASFSLMVLFSAYIVAILNYSEYIPCSCGGVIQHMSWNQHFWFNIFFVLASGIAVYIYPADDEIIAQ